MILTYKAKIYPTKAQEIKLNETLENGRLLYNRVLEARINHYKETGENISRFAQQKVFNGEGSVTSSYRQVIVYRVDLAFKRFFKAKKGFPRFKGENRMRSIELRKLGEDYKIIDGRLKTWKYLGTFKMRGFRGGNVKGMARIVKKGTNWYFNYPVQIEEKKTRKPVKKVGLDVGLKYFVSDSKGVNVDNPRFLRSEAFKVTIASRKLSKAKRGSNGRKKRKLELARIYERVTNRKNDWLHKLSTEYARKYDFIAVENLNISGMVRNRHLARSISDASWGDFLQMLAYKSKILGKTFIAVDPRYTSQTCICGAIVRKTLSVRTHICHECGTIEDRDVMSAKVILQRAWKKPSARVV